MLKSLALSNIKLALRKWERTRKEGRKNKSAGQLLDDKYYLGKCFLAMRAWKHSRTKGMRIYKFLAKFSKGYQHIMCDITKCDNHFSQPSATYPVLPSGWLKSCYLMSTTYHEIVKFHTKPKACTSHTHTHTLTTQRFNFLTTCIPCISRARLHTH